MSLTKAQKRDPKNKPIVELVKLIDENTRAVAKLASATEYLFETRPEYAKYSPYKDLRRMAFDDAVHALGIACGEVIRERRALRAELELAQAKRKEVAHVG